MNQATGKLITGGETIDFELSRSALQARRNVKWNQYEADVLPAFVAEMDFAVAAPIQTAIERIVRDGDYGYPQRDGKRVDAAVAAAFIARMKTHYGWDVSPDLVVPISDLVQGTFAPILAFSDPGDGVILQTPNYPPFREAITTTERRLISLPMRDDGTRHVFDFGELAPAACKDARIFVLCNPQNPTGRVFRRDELLAIARFVIEHDLIVVSDEIHSDLVYAGHRHIPFASLGPDVAARTVTLNSATKSFNIPGLRCAVLAFGSDALRARFHKRIPARLLGGCNIIGVDATVAAWMESQPWLDAVMAHLTKARDLVTEVLRTEVSDVRFHVPEATYLAWLDCRAIKQTGSAFQFFHDQARIAFSAGETFDPACAGFVRLNFATSMPILREILDRVVGSVKQTA
ncbi:MalY/PatB family protein [Bradyrhizobium sp.]|uniref:MalY/PatB family protein n=1 Tax=Bradyrhizobium sp. TaxID=376 RepID=UPI001EC83350|nr:PatB family C-S lyase [Bradyrhizobium sp.]MBV8917306.1 PatB family C-S lyase [Bradyrhizobium sp.]MBV9979673.1 PatB family C-S lyase [Bradyrhizobium sp.]